MIPRSLLLFLLVRLLSVLIIQTWFVADEYWQAIEIAHSLTFGYGYLTWEWKNGLRSVLYPAVFATFYKVLFTLGLDQPLLLIHLPRVLHAFAFSISDYYIWKLSKKLYNKESAHWTFICLLSSWFLEYCAPRTLTSCVEMTLTSISLWKYPWRKQKDSCESSYLWLIGISCIMRPTSAVLFIPLCLKHLWVSSRRSWLMLKFMFTLIIIVSISVGLDSWYYGRLIIVPWQFVHFNVVSGLSAHYGTHPWHWYFTQGLPATLTLHNVPFLLGALFYFNRHREVLPLCLWSLCIYSCLGHKEFRFLLPILPLCLCIAGDYIAISLSRYYKKNDSSSKQWSFVIATCLFVPNIIAVLYLGLIHQRGPLDTMAVLQKEINSHKNPNILFLMPCHSTPYYSHLHRNISMRFLTCEPNLELQDNYLDEADIFEEDPLSWLHQEYISNPRKNDNNMQNTSVRYGGLPSHIVLFDVLVNKIFLFLKENGFHKCHDIFHAHIQDGRRGKYIQIYCR